MIVTHGSASILEPSCASLLLYEGSCDGGGGAKNKSEIQIKTMY